VEDDAQIVRVLKLELEHEGYVVETAGDGLAGLEKALKEPDLVVLDLMLPKMDGMEICRRVRAKSSVPIIMLTAKDRIADRIGGLDTGGDDYLVKPFSVDELLARVRARLRERHPKSNVLTFRDLTMDRDRHEVKRAGKAIALPPKNTGCSNTCCCTATKFTPVTSCSTEFGEAISWATRTSSMCTCGICAGKSTTASTTS